MGAIEILRRATNAGFSVGIANGKLAVTGPTNQPAIIDEIKDHRDAIIHLIQRRYKPVFPHPDQRDDEMTELVRRVEKEGYVLLWCEVLRDLVAFHRDDVDPATIPAAFVPYSDDELRHLFYEDGVSLSAGALRLIHAAKKTGAIITNSEALSTPPKGSEHYTDRLRRGMDWLLEAWGRMPDDTTPALNTAFDRNLHAWRDLEEEMYLLYPEWRGCPIGNCVNEQPVMCESCSSTSRNQIKISRR